MGKLRLPPAVLLAVAMALQPVVVRADYPPGTVTFFGTYAFDPVAAPDGGVWAGTETGIAHYDASGQVTAVTTPGTGPGHDLAIAPDGSVWFAKQNLIARVSGSGSLLEHYPIQGAWELVVASDGAVWFAHGAQLNVGRIHGGQRTDLTTSRIWSMAPAANGSIWALGTGSGSTNDSLHLVDSSGVSTSFPLGIDILYGEIQVMDDGIVYISTGLHHEVFRFTPGPNTVERVSYLAGIPFVADEEGRIWTGGWGRLYVVGRDGSILVQSEMPDDKRRDCDHAYQSYEPAVIDSTGGVWIRVVEDGYGIIGFPVPCAEPEPPPFPDLIRIDAATFLAAHLPGHQVPTLSTILLVGLAALIAVIGARKIIP